MKNLFKTKEALKMSRADQYLTRVRDGEEKTRNEWALELYPGFSLSDAQARMGTLTSHLKKRKNGDRAFLAPIKSGGTVVEVDVTDDNHAVIISSRKRATSTMKNHVTLCEKSAGANQKQEAFYHKEAAAGIFVSLGEYLGKGADLASLGSKDIQKLIDNK